MTTYSSQDSLVDNLKDTVLTGIQTEIAELRERDRQLLTQLQEKAEHAKREYSSAINLQFYNAELAKIARPRYSLDTLDQIESLLLQKGTLTIPVVSGYTVRTSTTDREVVFVAATAVDSNMPNHGDMSSMLYLRDHIQAASALMTLHLQDPRRYHTEGDEAKQLIISALDLMSTPAQLARFADVTKQGPSAGQSDWPHISLRFGDMEATGPNGWRNIQDSFQMLGYLTLDALQKKFLQPNELTRPHIQFLSSIVPLLKAVGFPHYESSGSWEEVAAVRTSVMAVETAFLHKAKIFLQDNATAHLLSLSDVGATELLKTVDDLLARGLAELGRRLPYESPDYQSESVKYRLGDAALVYVLMYDIPKLLADMGVPIGQKQARLSREAIENLVLDQLSELDDPVTGGVLRYKDDSYQRVNFHTNEVQLIIKKIKEYIALSAAGEEIDLDEKQTLRNALTPKGKEAAWTHPLGQLASWAAHRALECLDEGNDTAATHYENLATIYLNRSLSLVTGAKQWHATLSKNGYYELRSVPAFRLPECYVTYHTPAGETFDVPSPHTPLNWSSAMTRQAIGLLYRVAARH